MRGIELMKKWISFILALLLLISIGFNVYFLYNQNRSRSFKSFDNKYSADILNFNYHFSIQIIATESNVTDKSAAGKIDFCSDTNYSNRFAFDVVWSPNSYNLFIYSSDIGSRCIHYDEETEQWGEYWCDVNENGDAYLYEQGRDKKICTVLKDSVPEKFLTILQNR